MSKRKPRYNELLPERRKKLFVGRTEERDAFRRNFGREVPEHLIFAIHGQAGIGKSFLIDCYQTIARENGALTAMTNEAEATAIQEQSILRAMARLAKQLSDADAPLKAFDEKYKKFREYMQQVETDPDAPQGVFDLLGRTTARLVTSGVRMTPVGQAAEGLLKDVGVDGEALVEQAGAWTAYLARKFKNKDAVVLVKEPVETLTPLFVAGVNALAEERPVVLCFDTWERTGAHLDEWLRGLLAGEGLSIGVWLVIAGRNPLADAWEPFYTLIASFELHEFTEEETRDYLKGQGITEEARVADILAFSGGIPVLVSTLSSARGGSATEAANGLVDRYLKWVDDERQRAAALNCAAARRLDKDVVAAVMREDEAVELFDWLREMPFIQSRPGYWEYHPKVRKLMLQFARSRSLKDFRAMHSRLQGYYQNLLTERAIENPYRDRLWRQYKLEALYHGLMAERAEAERDGLETFLLAPRRYYLLTGEVATTWKQAAEEQEADNPMTRWANTLEMGWATIESRSWREFPALCETLQSREDLDSAARSEVHFIAGLAFLVLQEYRQAIENYEQVIALSPEDAWAYIGQGLSYNMLQECERAIEDFGRAIALDPGFAVAYYSRGLTYGKLHEYERALEDFGQAIVLAPEFAAAYNYRGLTYAMLQEYEQAIEDYGRAIALNPEYATAYYHRGGTYYELQEYEQALEDCGQAIALDPGFAVAYFRRGLVYGKLQEYEQAIEDFGQVIALDPEFAAAYYGRGLAYVILQEYERAIEDFGRVIALDPEFAAAYNCPELTHAMLQEYEQAIEDYGQVIALSPENAWAYIGRGLAYYELQEYERAVEDYGQAIELNPGRAEVYNGRGIAYAKLQKYKRAVEDYGRAIALNPEYATAYYHRGLAYYKLQEYERAVEDYGQAIVLNPKLIAAYYNRSCAYALMNCVEEACEWLQKVIDFDEEYRGMAREDQDFDGIREYDCFKALMSADTSWRRTAPGEQKGAAHP